MSDSGDRDGDSDSSDIDFGVDDLNFEGRIAAEDFIGGDLKAMQEGGGLDGSFEIGSEGKQDMDILSSDASSK